MDIVSFNVLPSNYGWLVIMDDHIVEKQSSLYVCGSSYIKMVIFLQQICIDYL